MESVLRGEKVPEIEKVSESVYLFPVRHHSPVCGFHLKRAIAAFNPDVILIEGPENADGLIPVLTDPETRTPVACYYAYRDSRGYLGEKKAAYRCYYPFLECSPELVALREAKALGIPASFMDLPYGEILLGTVEGKGVRTGEGRQTYNDDYLLSRSRYVALLCEKAEVRDFEEFWERYFEQKGLRISTEEFVRQMRTYCELSRRYSSKEELLEDGCLLRERHMANRIRKALDEGKRVLAVTGGFHTSGIEKLLKEPQKADVPHPMEAGDQEVYPMAYSMEEADALNGYASGMQSPGFYDRVWRRLQAAEQGSGTGRCGAGGDDAGRCVTGGSGADSCGAGSHGVYEETVLEYLIMVGKKARRQEESVSSYDEICAYTMAKGLAALRGKAEPGLYELRDSVRSSYVKGEVNLSTDAPLRILRELTTGDQVGVLCKGAPRPPLLTDFEETCLAFGMKLHSALEQEVTLEIFSKEKHLRMSRFFYQLDFLEIGFARRTKGADLVNRRDRSRIREVWHYKWNSQVPARLIDVSIRGGTVEEAVTNLLLKRFYEANSCAEAARLLLQGFQMGLWEEEKRLQRQFREILAGDGDFFSLSRGFSDLVMLSELQALYQIREDKELTELTRSCFQKLLQMLPSMAGIADRQMKQGMECCLMLYRTTGRRTYVGLREPLMEGFERLLEQEQVQPGLQGAVMGLLYGQNRVYEKRIRETAAGYIHGTREMMPKSAAFLRGLFFTARDYVFVSGDFLKLIDELLDRLPDETFLQLLPELRMAFGYFTPLETDRIAGQAAALHGRNKSELLRGEKVLPAVYSYGERLDHMAGKQLLESDVLPG
ncbi:MAG: DUF5682 family protein [Eubacteriales bacterium]|nr:DUF5682 family protein [Eubacteriales bacterium]